MDEAASVSLVERVGHLREQRECAIGIERPFAREKLAQIRSVDIPHRQIDRALRLPKIEDRNRVRMVEARRDRRLANQSLAKSLVAGELRIEEFQRDAIGGALALGEVDGARGALPDQRDKPVPGDSGSDRGVTSHAHRA